MKKPKDLQDIRDQSIDEAEDSLVGLMKQNEDKRVKLDATKVFLKAKGRNRGWGETIEIIPGGDSVDPIQWVGTEKETDSDKD